MKNYVKEFDGRKVPKGAVYYNKPAKCFYNEGRDKYYHCETSNKWLPCIRSSVVCSSSNTIELPEVDEKKMDYRNPLLKHGWNGEGLPPVGTLCTISADGFEYLFSAASNELSSITESTELVVIGHCARHDNGAKCVTLMATDSTAVRGFTTVNPDFITPLKTQQEKDREAFINAARKATNADENDIVATDIFDDMFHAGFTAPKEGDNDK